MEYPMKFKVGDTVKRINEDGAYYFRVGDIATVIEIETEDNIKCTNPKIKANTHGGTYGSYATNLVLATKLEKALS